MIQEVVSVDLPVHERLVIKKNRLEPENMTGKEKRISIVTGTHGDELDGQYICYEIIKKIQMYPEKLKGIVDIYPDVNPLGIDMGSRGIPMFDLDMNRVFPGDNNGAVAEYTAAGLIDDIIGSDFCLDIHSSNIFLKEMPQLRMTEENKDKLLSYAKKLNADFIWIYSSKTVLDATLAYSLNNMGVPTLVAEMGVGHRINNEYCQQLIEGIFNLMTELEVWDDAPVNVRNSIVSTEGQVSFISAAGSGIFVSSINSMGTIGMGTHIGDIIEPITGKVIQRIESPTDGIIFSLREHPVVYKGALIARVYGGRKQE
ncbi:MAG: M14 family metallopeptidase [Lachnospira sp.]|nr:M14 family metallopeptidase [Lachnospira sp.]